MKSCKLIRIVKKAIWKIPFSRSLIYGLFAKHFRYLFVSLFRREDVGWLLFCIQSLSSFNRDNVKSFSNICVYRKLAENPQKAIYSESRLLFGIAPLPSPIDPAFTNTHTQCSTQPSLHLAQLPIHKAQIKILLHSAPTAAFFCCWLSNDKVQFWIVLCGVESVKAKFSVQKISSSVQSRVYSLIWLTISERLTWIAFSS